MSRPLLALLKRQARLLELEFTRTVAHMTVAHMHAKYTGCSVLLVLQQISNERGHRYELNYD
jgi:hypothetical protein